ncbi:MAG: hypothetical protein FJ086_20260, partial [Deltaproteobacteria bacterium]|nr:hypothetical protein [Deltaproteobacteria bacterium]
MPIHARSLAAHLSALLLSVAGCSNPLGDGATGGSVQKGAAPTAEFMAMVLTDVGVPHVGVPDVERRRALYRERCTGGERVACELLKPLSLPLSTSWHQLDKAGLAQACQEGQLAA